MPNPLFAPDPLIRIPLYIILGLMVEVLFTGIADLIYPKYLSSWNAKQYPWVVFSTKHRDPRAMGYTFLWMIPFYALYIFFEPASAMLKDYSIWLRGLIYFPGFWVGEYIGGAVIKKITGRCPWDYSYSRFSFHGYIRWDFAPFWYLLSILIDFLSAKFVLLTPYIKQVF